MPQDVSSVRAATDSSRVTIELRDSEPPAAPVLRNAPMPTLVARPVRKGPKLSVKSVRELCDRMLAALDLADAELSVLLVDDVRIQSLNREHREMDKPTDVLAFPQDESPPEGAPRLLGDIVISLETALRQARSRKRTLLPEVRFLLAHGLLHLLGFDHANPRDKRRMDAATRRLVRRVTPSQPRAKSRTNRPPRRRPAGRSRTPRRSR